MNVSIWIAVTTALILGFTLGAKFKIEAEFTKFECLSYLPELLQVNCSNVRTSKNISLLNTELKVSKDIFNLRGNFSILIQRGNKMFNYSTIELDYCTAMGTLFTDYINQMVFKQIRQNSNLPLNCPFKKHKLYYVKEFQLDTKILPSYLPEVSFISDSILTTNQIPILRLQTAGRLRRRKTL